MKIEVHETMMQGFSMKYAKSAGILFLVACLSILNINMTTALAAEIKTGKEVAMDATDKTKADTARVATASSQELPPIKVPQSGAPDPETTTNSSGKTLLYAGVGIAAVAAVAAVAVGASSSSNSEPEPPTPTLAPIGADIGGESWTGFLDLVDGIKENVTAIIYQNGAYVEITTSTTQKYGHKFVGQISRSGVMTMYDQTTGQDWTTFYDAATWNRIDLYDYVHNNKELDRLYLTRTSKD